MYDRDSEDAVPALAIGETPLTWFPLDDGIMQGKSEARIAVRPGDKTLQFEGTIDTKASVGWASARASLPPEGLPVDTKALRFTFVGDGKTYKVILIDCDHEVSTDASPLWEADLPTTTAVKESKTIPLQDFIPSYMGRQLTIEEKAKHASLDLTKLSKIGFMLSSRLSNGSQNPVNTYGQGVFQFSLNVRDVALVQGDHHDEE